MPHWVVEGLIATSSRPGYTPGPETAVPPEHVAAWCQETRAFGIASIICLISKDQLPLYYGLPGNLLDFYRQAGFAVAHVPTLDGLTVPYSDEQYDYAWNEFLRLPKPVLVHCSAGMDRTGRIVRHILAQMDGAEFRLE